MPTAVGSLHLLWWWALDYAPDGDLSPFTTTDIADACLWEGDADRLWQALLAAGFIDAPALMHDWEEHVGTLLERRQRERDRHLALDEDSATFVAMLRRDPCCYCGTVGEIHIDHIEPRVFGGGLTWENLTAACKSCNSAKRERSLLVFLGTRPWER